MPPSIGLKNLPVWERSQTATCWFPSSENDVDVVLSSMDDFSRHQTQPVFSGPAVDRLNAAPIDEIVVTNTVPLAGKDVRRLTVLSVGPLLGEAIRRTHGRGSVSSLFV